MKSWAISLSFLVAGTILLLSADQVAAETIATIDSIVGGQVSLNKPSWQDYRPVQIGTSLENGDFVLPDEGTKVSVVCENGDIWVVPDGIVSSVDKGCPSAEPTTSEERGRNCGILCRIFGEQDRPFAPITGSPDGVEMPAGSR